MRLHVPSLVSFLFVAALLQACTSDPPTDCTPATCESIDIACGTHDDLCGGTIVCQCPTGHDCIDDACIPEGCEPASCETLGVDCGTHSDLCGGTIVCPCPAGHDCIDDACVPEGCEPATCETLGVDCGTHDNLCGGTIVCPCPAGHDCIDDACVPEGCEPASCETLGIDCGTHDNLCGGTIVCQCPAGHECIDDACVPEICSPSCFVPQSGSPDATVGLAPGQPPSLQGGPISSEWYGLEEIFVYADDFLASAVDGTITVASNGNTFGSIEFRQDEWGLDAQMDLHLQIDTLLTNPIAEDFLFRFDAGGCFEITNTLIVTDIGACQGEWPDGSGAPPDIEYQVEEDEIRLLVVIERDTIVNQLPADYQGIGNFLITGDLPVLMRFVR